MRTTTIIGKTGVCLIIILAWVLSIGLSIIGVLRAYLQGNNITRMIKREVFIYKIGCLSVSLVGSMVCNAIVYFFVKRQKLMINNAVKVMVNVVKTSFISMVFIWAFEVR